jgi:hypothetical protein
MRASAAGFRNVIRTNLLVYHAGGKSFGDQKNALVVSALAVMRQIHPGYNALVARFIADDPLLPYRLKASPEAGWGWHLLAPD